MSANIRLNTDTFSIKPEKIHEDIENYNNITKQNKNFLEIMLVNIRSMKKNFNNLVLYLNQLSRKPYILVCTETWKLLCPNFFNLPEYNFLL